MPLPTKTHPLAPPAPPPPLMHSNATLPSYLSSLAATHRFTSLSRIFCASASPSPRLKPPDDGNRTAQYSMANATSAILAESPIRCVMHVALDASPVGAPCLVGHG